MHAYLEISKYALFNDFFLKQTHKNNLSSVGAHCWCRGVMQDSHSCDPGSIPGQCTQFFIFLVQILTNREKNDIDIDASNIRAPG